MISKLQFLKTGAAKDLINYYHNNLLFGRECSHSVFPKIYLFEQVPIIKMVDLPTEVKVDISINNDSSIKKAELIRVSSDLLCYLNNFAKQT